MNSPARQTEPAVLTSWKEVAAYLGKGVRTVQRWEKDDGLPVRRIGGTSKIVVQREDLDRWLRNQPGVAKSETGTSALLESLQESKKLRSRNVQLRASVAESMAHLMDECRRMQSTCSGREQNAPSKLSDGGEHKPWANDSAATEISRKATDIARRRS